MSVGREPRDSVNVVVRVGPGENAFSDVEQHRDRCRFSRKNRLQICGHDAQRFVVACPEEHIACVMVESGTPGGNHPDYIPPMTTWGLAFDSGKLPGSVSIEMPTAFAGALAPMVERTFASIRCGAP